MTTFRAFVDAVEALVVTGVTRRYTEGPPASVAADLPAQYVRLPSGSEGPSVIGEPGHTIGPELRCELVILVEPSAQDTPAANFDNTIDMMDNLSTAIRAAGRCWPGSSFATWTIRQAIDAVAGTEYWAVIATIEGR